MHCAVGTPAYWSDNTGGLPLPCRCCAVIQQVQQIPQDWSTWPFIALCLLFVYAAFPPALVGAKEEDFGIFRVAAEKTNGRAAMLGLAVLAALEWHSGFCFF